jgi:hypothetical protein
VEHGHKKQLRHKQEKSRRVTPISPPAFF